MTQPIILITGSSRGIGAATALLAADAGYAVCVNYKTKKTAATKIVKQIKQKGGHAICVQADVSKETEVTRLFDTIDDKLGPLSALVNNAGILQPKMHVEDMCATRINTILTHNVTSAFLCAKAAILRMSTSHGGQGGSIVNVTSAAARTGSPFEYIDYAASKGALDSMTKGLSIELASSGIRVNAVRPALIDTDIHTHSNQPDRVQQKKHLIPLQQIGTAQDVAHAVLYLLSDKADFITGSFIDVSGGL